MDNTRRPARDWRRVVSRVSGAGLLVATGAIHLDLYLTGYRTLPTIGGLFLLQVVVAFGLGVVVLASGSRLLAAAGAGFALSTLGGYLLTMWIGLFGFREVRTTAGIAAGVIEIGAFAALAVLALTPRPRRQPVAQVMGRHRLTDRLQAGFRDSGLAVAGLSVVALAVLSVSVAVSGPTGTVSTGAVLKIAKIGKVMVLTDSRGFTLYWFALDTSGKSRCNGSCAAYWPPVTGAPVAGPGVLGTLGTIKRSTGVMQVTYAGHPLYTYVGDSGPDETNGNGVNLNGGLWHEMAASG